MSFEIQQGEKILFTGDSITDCGRRGDRAPLGGGYVRMVHDLIMARYPEHGVSIVNTGISGNTVRDLTNRWTDDVILHQPDWLSIMIGINDVHRWMANIEGQSVNVQEYEDMYRKILQRVVSETSAKIILLEPFYISRDAHGDNHRTNVLKNLEGYRAVAAKMSEEFGTKFVPLHSHFQRILKHYAIDDLCPEPVHPNPSGHLVMAHEWLRTMGF